jgi:hypothetical protein
VAIETVLPFKLILNVVRSGVSEFDTSLMTWLWDKEEPINSELSVDVRFGAYSLLRWRVANRYDRLAANYLAFIKLASIRIWLRANESVPYASSPQGSAS